MTQKKNENPYLERDISWMYFNKRILQEAGNKEVPLLERINFLGIYSNNLDEFYRVRVASLNRIAECTDKIATKDKEKAQKTIKKINKLNSKYACQYEDTIKDVTRELEKENIFIITEENITEEQLKYIENLYREKLNGFIVPVWFSSVDSIESETDENIYLAVRLNKSNPKKVSDYAYLEVPVNICGRFVRLPDCDGKSFLMYLEDVIRCCMPLVFEGLEYNSYDAYSFKFTRDSEMEIDNDLRTGILQKISRGVKSRKKGEPLRVIYDGNMPKDLINKIIKKLNVDAFDTILSGGRYQNHKDFMKFPDCGRKDLKYPEWKPIMKHELDGKESILGKIQEKDRFIHVPYQNFDSFIRVLQESAINKHVSAIRITLYRLAKESKVIKALIGAAKNGKKVTVVIELLARFDEASNILWSKKMQEAGINVIFGVEGLKVHSKIAHIEMKKGPNIACISTGNFHEGNAKMYTDCILMTAAKKIVNDVLAVFKFIEKPYTPIKFKELLVSPNEMKNKFITLINNEIKNQKNGKTAYIKIKINHITDPVIVDKLYEASQAGVKIELLLRGNNSLITGLPDISENISIKGIIDRYLEHSRIFIFANGGDEKIFMGSADWMPRNLDNRIEVITPVYDEAIKEELRLIVDYGLKDTIKGHIVDGFTNDDNIVLENGVIPFRSQEELYKHYLSENK